MKYCWKLAAAALATVLLGSQIVPADTPGRHPGYLHALSDLRWARALIEGYDHGPAMRDQDFAIREIDAAIREIRRASIDDGKDLRDHPRIEPGWRPRDRFHRALEAIAMAHRNVAEREDNIYAQGLRDRAIHHIDEAHRAVEHAIMREGW